MMLSCGICQAQLVPEKDIKCPLSIVLHALESVRIKCPGGCQNLITYGDVKRHDCSKPTNQASNSQLTLTEVCNTRLDKTPTDSEWRTMGHLVRRVMKSSSSYGDENGIIIPTGGQVRGA